MKDFDWAFGSPRAGFDDNDPDRLNYHEYKLRALINEIKYRNRFVLRDPYKSFAEEIVKDVLDNYTSRIPKGTILYRARINGIDYEDNENELPHFPPEEMGPPPYDLARPGRANPEGIPYLYCAEDIDTAGSEVRPWKGAKLTIAELKTKRDIVVADLTLECKESKLYFFHDTFSELFSIQWPQDLKVNYLPTQYFSEHFKVAGLSGVRYKSDFNEGGINYSLFHKDDYEITRTYGVEAIGVYFHFYKKDP
jgi:RES domain-containing protein